ncbi:unnamed protein product [Paramecium primaurelia]|uniref:Uncharacterized protein n=1 Tax=Paramecium primaurelia TaxID=5886 RepID=A0A8S1LUF9_PARPR|nr:unnamed protein product [Paramecium primaurelia]
MAFNKEEQFPERYQVSFIQLMQTQIQLNKFGILHQSLLYKHQNDIHEYNCKQPEKIHQQYKKQSVYLTKDKDFLQRSPYKQIMLNLISNNSNKGFKGMDSILYLKIQAICTNEVQQILLNITMHLLIFSNISKALSKRTKLSNTRLDFNIPKYYYDQ